MSSVTDRTVVLRYAGGGDVEAEISRRVRSSQDVVFKCIGTENRVFGTLTGWEEMYRYHLFGRDIPMPRQDQWFWVEQLNNHTLSEGDKKVQGVGRELILCGIKESLGSPQMGGRLGLFAVRNSFFFYGKMGLRVVPESDWRIERMALYLRLKYQQSTPQDLVDYEQLRSTLAESRGVNPDTLSLEDVCGRSLSSIIDEGIAKGGHQIQDLGSAYMYLPPDQIDRYRAQFR